MVVRVSDTGCGMAPEMLTNIFDPGYSSKGGSGHGVGLAHARATIRDLGGEILVRSELGVGTQFALVIPRLTDRQADANDWPVGWGFDAFPGDSDDHGARNGEADETAGDAADDPIEANAIDLRDCREDQVGGLVEQPSEIAFDGGIDLPAAATAIGLEESSLVDDDEFLPNALGSPVA